MAGYKDGGLGGGGGGPGGGLTEPQHEGLNTLTHELVTSRYEEAVYSGARLVGWVAWTDGTKTVKLREEAYTFIAGKVSVVAEIQYVAGVESYRLTETFAYVMGRWASTGVVRT